MGIRAGFARRSRIAGAANGTRDAAWVHNPKQMSTVPIPHEADPSRARAFLAETCTLVDQRLDTLVAPRPDDRLNEAMRYSLFAGGKRLRPALSLATTRCLGGNEEHTLTFGCAVEMIHTYSLIHDDLPAMDDDDLRRGKPTCHKVFGEALAILAGDALHTHAFRVLLESTMNDTRARRLSSELAKAAGSDGMVAGQVRDLAAGGTTPDADTLRSIHRLKTGALISAAVQGGAICADASPSDYGALRTYGEQLGLAFQIVDDVLDATASTNELGKTAGKDDATNKMTYVALYGVKEATRKAALARSRALEAIRSIPGADVLASLAHFVTSRRA